MINKLSKKDKFYRMMKANKSADEIYMTFIKSKSEKEKIDGLELLKEYAKINNKENDVRAKALALLGHFKSMSCGKDAEEFFSDIKFISEDPEIPKIIEGNIEELIEKLERMNIDLKREDELNDLLIETMLVIEDFGINTNISNKFFKLLLKKLNLKKKKDKGVLNQREDYIFKQLQRMQLIKEASGSGLDIRH
jgi:hypothetical protein